LEHPGASRQDDQGSFIIATRFAQGKTPSQMTGIARRRAAPGLPLDLASGMGESRTSSQEQKNTGIHWFQENTAMKRISAVAALASLLLASWCPAWWVQGHESITEAATGGLPEDVPAFFRAAGKQLAHYAGDPDRWKNPSARYLRAAEAPDHFLDLEDYQDRLLPVDRYQAIALLIELKQKPERTGMLPYAIMENYDRLSCAFFDLRADPKNAAIQAKCLVHAGTLAHLTGDCVMPLHTTRNYDGRPGERGKLVQKGIHARIDASPERHGLTTEEIGRGLKALVPQDIWTYVMTTLRESHKHVERCYELDQAGGFDKPTAESRAFILQRCRAGAQFTMDLWYSAWLRSAKMPKHY
jgi:hypothetical protein